MSTTKHQRESAVNNAIKDADTIVKKTIGATFDSKFFNQQLPLLAASPDTLASPSLIVEYGDTLALTRRMQEWHPEFKNQVMILNMADDRQVAGGFETRTGSSQEDMLCYQTTLFATLKRMQSVYPFDKHLAANEKNGCGAIYSPGVVVYRGGPEKIFGMLKDKERWVTSVVSIAAPFRPVKANRGGQERYAKPQDEVRMREKLRMICRIGVASGKKVLVVGAFGCGFFGNPVKQVAEMMKAVVLEEEFAGVLTSVYWFINDEKMYEDFHATIVL